MPRRTAPRGSSAAKLEFRLEQHASKYCERRAGYCRLIGERFAQADASDPARIELVFVCTRLESEASIIGGSRSEQLRLKAQEQRAGILSKLSELHASGALSEKEYEAERAKITGR